MVTSIRQVYRGAGVAAAALLILAACSGGGSSKPQGWVKGTFQPASDFYAKCASPRTGTDPITGQPYPDTSGTTLDENNWLRSWSNDTYLWYNEIQDVDPANYTPATYFPILKTFATTPSGAQKDRFHFTYPTTQWEQLSQSGVSAGYGATFSIISGTPPRSIVVAYTQPNSPATASTVNLARGAQILTVDGVDVVNSNTTAAINSLNAGLFPSNTGETHTFTIQDLGASTTRSITMTSTTVTETPVQDIMTIADSNGAIGYMVFNDHIATAEQELIDAINQLKTAGVTDLILDLRYNGGGYLDIASELAYMIAGPATAGQTFELTQFNNKHPNVDPVTGMAIQPMPFHDTALGLSATAGQALPSLDLSSVYVITGSGTCSASESIINSLRGVGVSVYEIGSTTCGKPYGFYPTDDCGTTYFTIQFRGVNAINFGDYPDGFSPDNVASPVGVPIAGCQVADDFTHALGDTSEARLAAAIQYRDTATCPTVTGLTSMTALTVPGTAPRSAVEAYTPKSAWLENRILRR